MPRNPRRGRVKVGQKVRLDSDTVGTVRGYDAYGFMAIVEVDGAVYWVHPLGLRPLRRRTGRRRG